MIDVHGDTQRGQIVGKAGEQGQGPGRAGDEAGIDYYETDIELAELIDILFEDLELPDMERKKLNSTITERLSKRKARASPSWSMCSPPGARCAAPRTRS